VCVSVNPGGTDHIITSRHVTRAWGLHNSQVRVWVAGKTV